MKKIMLLLLAVLAIYLIDFYMEWSLPTGLLSQLRDSRATCFADGVMVGVAAVTFVMWFAMQLPRKP